jgi:hypothetical protein
MSRHGDVHLAVKWLPALRRFCAPALLSAGIAAAPAATSSAADPAGAAVSSRVEARSTDLLAVGIVHADRMTIHLSRLIDNAPVRDAVVAAVLRGTSHPTIAEADGSYTFESKDLSLPGAAAVEFQVSQAAVNETLKGTLKIAGAGGGSEDKNSSRQLWWWVLNFAVCIGFLWMFTRRRKNAQS